MARHQYESRHGYMMHFVSWLRSLGIQPPGRDAQQSKEMRLRQELVETGRQLHTQGFVASTDGNLSVCLEDGLILITPTRFSKARMRPEDMVVVDVNQKKIRGTQTASSELAMHLTIYRMRPDIGAVVHAHPCTATAFAAAGLELDESVCSEAVITLGSVPLAPYATPGTPALSEVLEPFIPDHHAILMTSHGVVTYGEDLFHAYMRMEAVEHFARIVLATRQLGAAKNLAQEDLKKLRQARQRYLGKSTA
jgi:L-fuculose-phosphate aldolase